MKRRVFLRGTLAGGVLVVAAGAGLLRPVRVLASSWPAGAFESETPQGGLSAYFGTSEAQDSDGITLKAPLQAENGAVVPVKVETTLPEPEAIAIVVDKNPLPFVTSLEVGGALGYYSARIKMGETSQVRCYVKSGGKLHHVAQEIKVTVGGCGG